MLVQTTHQWRN